MNCCINPLKSCWLKKEHEPLLRGFNRNKKSCTGILSGAAFYSILNEGISHWYNSGSRETINFYNHSALDGCLRPKPPQSRRSLRGLRTRSGSRRKDIGRSLRGQVFATKQRSDAGAHLCPSPSVTLFGLCSGIEYLLLYYKTGKMNILYRKCLKIWSKIAKTPRGPSEVLRSTRAKCNETELAQREPPGKRSCFAEYRFPIFFLNKLTIISYLLSEVLSGISSRLRRHLPSRQDRLQS